MMMKAFKKHNLQFNYSWDISKKHDNKWAVGFSETRNLNRNEGYEVLPFLNRYMRSRHFETEQNFHLVENLIQTALPANILTHCGIKDWLDANCCF